MLGADQWAVTARAAPGRHDAPVSLAVQGPGPGQGIGQGIGREAAVAAAALLLSLGLLVGGASGAGAAEWLVGGSVSQRVEADTNADLDENGAGVYGTTTALGLDLTVLTPTTQWQVETGASVGFFGGPGDTEDLNRLNPNFAAAVAHNGKYLDTGASFAFDMQPVSLAQIDETGVTGGDATQISTQLAANAAYALDARNQLSVGGSGRVIRFTRGSTTLEPTTTYGANLAWIRDLSAVTQGSLAFGARRFTAESDQDPDSLTFDLSAGVDRVVNGRLSFSATLGVNATRTTQTLAGERNTDFTLGALGGLEAAWQAAPDTQLVFAFSHGLEPSSVGELQTTTALGVGLQHEVNSWMSAGINALVQRQSSGGGYTDETDRTFASLSPSLAFSLTPDWALRAGYSLDAQHESGSDAISNRVFLTLTRQFDILR